MILLSIPIFMGNHESNIIFDHHPDEEEMIKVLDLIREQYGISRLSHGNPHFWEKGKVIYGAEIAGTRLLFWSEKELNNTFEKFEEEVTSYLKSKGARNVKYFKSYLPM